MTSSNQGGSILSFLIIGGVLAVLLIGGAYAVQQRSRQPATEQAPVAVQPAEEPANEAENKPAPAASDKQEAPKQDETKPAPQVQPAPATELPRTGPVDALASIIGVSLLSGMIVAYVRSRRYSVTL